MTRLMEFPPSILALWAAVAFLAAWTLYWLAGRRGPVLTPAWLAIGLLTIAGLVPVFAYVRSLAPYYVLVKVSGPSAAQLDKTVVWSSVEADSTKVPGGWQIRIPASSVPETRTILVWGAMDRSDLTHAQAVTLAEDHRPTVTIRISSDRSASISGWVRTREGRPMEGALVSLAGHSDSAVLTGYDGRFSIPAGAAAGDQIRLQVAANGKVSLFWANAGDTSATLTVDTN